MTGNKLIKVCGMTDGQNINDIDKADIDLIGFVFYPQSPRCVGEMPGYLPQKAKRVGVFVDEDPEHILSIARRFDLDYLQLHGHETVETCRRLRAEGFGIIKNFAVSTANDLTNTTAYEGACDYFLFDTRCESRGGSGRSFDWSLLEHYNGQTPFLLSGGIGPDSVSALRAFDHPRLAGYDLNSRFETRPGYKNADQIHTFVKAIKTKTMNRINQLFANKAKDILSIYFCAGAPRLDNTAEVIKALAHNGVDMIEIGIPFSDPMADGPVIQNAATQALKNGMSLRVLFEQLATIRQKVGIPLLLMGYLNPIMHFGFERFCSHCAACGIDGVIIPDLPFRDYEEEYRAIAERYGVKVIMLITPETDEARVRLIDQSTDAFIYMVSSAATTGAQADFDAGKQAYFKRISGMNLKNPLMVGFGISNKATFDAACQHASGAIIGSRFVVLLNETNNPAKAIQQLKAQINEATPLPAAQKN